MIVTGYLATHLLWHIQMLGVCALMSLVISVLFGCINGRMLIGCQLQVLAYDCDQGFFVGDYVVFSSITVGGACNATVTSVPYNGVFRLNMGHVGTAWYTGACLFTIKLFIRG